MRRVDLIVGKEYGLKLSDNRSVERVVVLDIHPWASSVGRTYCRPTSWGNGVAVARVARGSGHVLLWVPDVVQLPQIVGPYDDAKTIERLQCDRERQAREQKRQEELDAFERVGRLQARIRALTGRASARVFRSHVGDVTIALDVLEELVTKAEEV